MKKEIEKYDSEAVESVARETDLELNRDKVDQAIVMRLQGKPWHEIATMLGYKNLESAIQLVHRELTRRSQDYADHLDQYRAKMLVELEEMSRKAWEVVLNKHVTVSHGRVIKIAAPDGTMVELEDDGPTLAALDRLLRIQERKAKLLGIDAPTKHDVGLRVNYVINNIEVEQLR